MQGQQEAWGKTCRVAIKTKQDQKLRQSRPAAKTKYSLRVIFSPILPTSTPVSHLHPTRAATHIHTHDPVERQRKQGRGSCMR
jgi:hypothetical protein